MNKKGEVSLNFMIMLIIAVVVLFVILIIFRQQVVNFVGEIGGLITGYGDKATDLSKGLIE
jgi:hypothetical protein